MKGSGKSFEYFLIGLKLLLGVVLVWLFYHQLQTGNLSSLEAFERKDTFYLYLGMAVVLMPLNWVLESVKWTYLLPEVAKMSWKNGVMQVLKGITLGIITPGRLGDYGGRLIHMEKPHHMHAMAATFAGSLAQNIIQFLTGAVCIYLLMDKLMVFNYDYFFIWIILTVSVICALFVLFFYPKQLHVWVSGVPWLNKYEWLKKMLLLVNFSNSKLFVLLGLAFFRYLTYAVQYILIMKALNVEMDIFYMMQAVGVIYFFQSLLPLPPLLNWLGRGEIAVLVLGQFDVIAIYALICTYLLWFINLGIPALLGYILILKGGQSFKNAEISANGQIKD